jgi:hypothetical protein
MKRSVRPDFWRKRIGDGAPDVVAAFPSTNDISVLLNLKNR